MGDKSPLKGAWSGYVNHLHVWCPNHIYGIADTRVVKFCTQERYVNSQLAITKHR